jgi:amidase
VGSLPPPLPSAAEIVRRVRGREVSPVEIVAAALARADALDPALNALVTRNPAALEEARAVEARLERGEDPGPLAGVPVGIKDVTEVAGLRCTYGSPLHADHVPSEDAEVVRRLRAAGAVILGKTNTPEFAAGGHTDNAVFGATRNPWDPARSPGGSTGGGAAALAAGMIALAQGTDLGGSLRIPAAFCGVVGLRPTVGLVPTWPQAYRWDTLQVTGVMARSAEDVALGLGAIAGPSARAPLSSAPGPDPLVAVRAASPRGMRIAYCRDVAGIGVDADVEATCRAAVEALARAGAEVEEVALDLSRARPAFLALRGLWFVAQLRAYLDRIEALGENVARNVRAGLATTTRQLADAESVRADVAAEMARIHARCDLLLTPTVAVPPFRVDEGPPSAISGRPMTSYVDWLAPTFVLSLTGLPVVSVPAGLDRSGLPAGLQAVAPARREDLALALAAAVQALRPLPDPPVG